MCDLPEMNKKIKKNTAGGEIGENYRSGIEKLSDDCLIEIFQYLPTISDKIRMERVSKKWRTLSQKSWSKFKYLNFYPEAWGTTASHLRELVFRKHDLNKIILLSGRYLTRINSNTEIFSTFCHLLSNNIRVLQLKDICYQPNKKCPTKFSFNLTTLVNVKTTTRQCTLDAWKIIHSWLISHGQNIVNFTMELNHSHFKEDDFATFLGEMKQLKYFNLYNCDFLNSNGCFLLALPFDVIQEISCLATHVLPFENDTLSTMIKKCKKLERICLTELQFSTSDPIFDSLPSQAATLKILSLGINYRFSNLSVIPSSISKLIHLEKLDFNMCFYILDDLTLEIIAQNCKNLTFLNLFYCCELTDRGISSLCDLKKLTYLNIGALTHLRNPPLERFTNLVILELFFNQFITDECLCPFLNTAHQLRALNIGSCPLITNRLLEEAIKVAKERNSNKTLDLYIYSCGITINSIEDKPPLLNLLNAKTASLVRYGIEPPYMYL